MDEEEIDKSRAPSTSPATITAIASSSCCEEEGVTATQELVDDVGDSQVAGLEAPEETEADRRDADADNEAGDIDWETQTTVDDRADTANEDFTAPMAPPSDAKPGDGSALQVNVDVKNLNVDSRGTSVASDATPSTSVPSSDLNGGAEVITESNALPRQPHAESNADRNIEPNAESGVDHEAEPDVDAESRPSIESDSERNEEQSPVLDAGCVDEKFHHHHHHDDEKLDDNLLNDMQAIEEKRDEEQHHGQPSGEHKDASVESSAFVVDIGLDATASLGTTATSDEATVDADAETVVVGTDTSASKSHLATFRNSLDAKEAQILDSSPVEPITLSTLKLVCPPLLNNEESSSSFDISNAKGKTEHQIDAAFTSPDQKQRKQSTSSSSIGTKSPVAVNSAAQAVQLVAAKMAASRTKSTTNWGANTESPVTPPVSKLIQKFDRVPRQEMVKLEMLVMEMHEERLKQVDETFQLQSKVKDMQHTIQDLKNKLEEERQFAVLQAPPSPTVKSQGANNSTTPDQQQALMEESGKMLEYLRKEVLRLRSENSHLKETVENLNDNANRLMEANTAAEASFSTLNQHARAQKSKSAKKIELLRQQIQELKLEKEEQREEIRMKQAAYVAEVHSRLKYQETLSKVVDLVQDQCRDSRLVEKVFQISDDADDPASDDLGTLEDSSSPHSTAVTPDSNHTSPSMVRRITSFFG